MAAYRFCYQASAISGFSDSSKTFVSNLSELKWYHEDGMRVNMVGLCGPTNNDFHGIWVANENVATDDTLRLKAIGDIRNCDTYFLNDEDYIEQALVTEDDTGVTHIRFETFLGESFQRGQPSDSDRWYVKEWGPWEPLVGLVGYRDSEFMITALGFYTYTCQEPPTVECGPNEVVNVNGECISTCEEGTVAVNDECIKLVTDCYDPEEELFNGECVPKCYGLRDTTTGECFEKED